MYGNLMRPGRAAGRAVKGADMKKLGWGLGLWLAGALLAAAQPLRVAVMDFDDRVRHRHVQVHQPDLEGAAVILEGDGLADLEGRKNALGLLRGCRRAEHHDGSNQQRNDDKVFVHVDLSSQGSGNRQVDRTQN